MLGKDFDRNGGVSEGFWEGLIGVIEGFCEWLKGVCEGFWEGSISVSEEFCGGWSRC